jgi:hypothetical protein
MLEGQPSATAQRTVAYRPAFQRLPAPFGDPTAAERLARDVAAGARLDRDERMAGYLQARTSFFDRVGSYSTRSNARSIKWP